MARLAVSYWIDAYLRRVERAGGYGLVVRKGNQSEGAVIILARASNGEIAVYEPAITHDTLHDRRWSLTRKIHTQEEIAQYDQRLERQIQRDPDMWVIDITSKDAHHYLTEHELV